MPPSYKPIQVQAPQGLTADAFATPSLSWEDASKTQALLRAQQISNEANQLQLEERQRQEEDKQRIRDALQTNFGGEWAGLNPVNPDEAYQLAQKVAIESGDWQTAMTIEKAGKGGALSPGQRQLFQSSLGIEIPADATAQDLNTLAALQKAQTYAQQVSDPKIAKLRDLNAILAEQRATGNQIRPATAAQSGKVAAANSFIGQMDNLEQTYLPYVAENRAERFLTKAANPNSAEFRMQAELDLAAKSAALALEDRVTDKDFETIQKITLINDLDTPATVLDKMRRLKEYIYRRANEDVSAATANGFNVSGLRNPQSLQIPRAGTINVPNPEATPPLANYGLPRRADGRPLSREEFMAQRGQ